MDALRTRLIILFVALLHGLAYVLLVPPWQHYDEPNHFEYAWLVANKPGWPQPGDYDWEMRHQVALSMIEAGFFAGMELKPLIDNPDRPPWIGTYAQLEDPPLYYLLASLPLQALPTAGIETQLIAARLVSLGLYLLTIVAAFGVTAELTGQENPLRWLVPLLLAMLPGFTDSMTAVNSDAGAVAIFSLFLWGSLGLFRRGFSWGRFLGTGLVALLGLWTTNSVALAIPLFGLALGLVLVPPKHRRWVWIGLLSAVFLGGLVGGSWQDAAYWARASAQNSSTRGRQPMAPLGDYALQLDPMAKTTPQWIPPISQPLAKEAVGRLTGQTVTLGAWMWASRPTTALTPRLHDGTQVANLEVDLGTKPAFYAFSTTVAEDTYRIWVTLSPPKDPTPGAVIYTDGLVLASGERPVDEPPQFSDDSGQRGTWGGAPFTNALRNPSGENVWPSLKPWADDLGVRFLPDQSRPSMLIYSLLDLDSTSWYYRAAGTRLLRTFWAKFGWGHVSLVGSHPYRPLAFLTALGLIGNVFYLFLQRKDVLTGDTLLWLVLLLWGIWGAALLRGVIYIHHERLFLPVARYALPASIPTVILLISGWLGILGSLGRWISFPPRNQYILLVTTFLGLDLLSIYSILLFYSERVS
jgi:hypothetical protein